MSYPHRDMFRSVSALALLSIALLVACNGDDGDATPTATSAPATATSVPSTPGPTAEPTDAPLPTPAYRGGIPSVDAAIAAVASRDADALIAQMRYTMIECHAQPEGLSIYPRCNDEADRTLVQTFPTASCEGTYARPGDARQQMRTRMDQREGSVLIGVFLTEGSRAEDSMFSHAAPVYAIVLSSGLAKLEGAYAWTLFAGERGIVGLSAGCGESPADYVAFWEYADPVTGP